MTHVHTGGYIQRQKQTDIDIIINYFPFIFRHVKQKDLWRFLEHIPDKPQSMPTPDDVDVLVTQGASNKKHINKGIAIQRYFP